MSCPSWSELEPTSLECVVRCSPRVRSSSDLPAPFAHSLVWSSRKGAVMGFLWEAALAATGVSGDGVWRRRFWAAAQIYVPLVLVRCPICVGAGIEPLPLPPLRLVEVCAVTVVKCAQHALLLSLLFHAARFTLPAGVAWPFYALRSAGLGLVRGLWARVTRLGGIIHCQHVRTSRPDNPSGRQ